MFWTILDNTFLSCSNPCPILFFLFYSETEKLKLRDTEGRGHISFFRASTQFTEKSIGGGAAGRVAAPLTSLLGRSATAACATGQQTSGAEPRRKTTDTAASVQFDPARYLICIRHRFESPPSLAAPTSLSQTRKMSGKLVIALFSGGKCSKLSSLLRLFDSQLKKGSDGLLRRSAAAVVVDVAGLRVVVRREGEKSPKQPRCFIIAALKLLGCQVDCFDCLFFLSACKQTSILQDGCVKTVNGD